MASALTVGRRFSTRCRLNSTEDGFATKFLGDWPRRSEFTDMARSLYLLT